MEIVSLGVKAFSFISFIRGAEQKKKLRHTPLFLA